MEHTVKINLFSGAAVLAGVIGASMVTSTIVASKAMTSHAKQQAIARQEITVKGSARSRVTSDLATWSASVRSEGKTLNEAYEALTASADRVTAFLTARGFKPEEVRLSAISSSPFYERDAKGVDTREVAGYALARQFTITTPDTARVSGAAVEVTSLLKDGVNVSTEAPEYTLTKLPNLRIKLLGEAAQDARKRADEIVKNAGGSVGEVRSAQMGVLQITEPNSTEVSGTGRYDTSTIEKDISAVVTVTFGVQ